MRAGISVSALCGVALLLGTSVGVKPETASTPAEMPPPRIPSDFVTSLQVDYLNDAVQPAAAWKVNAGVLPSSGEARFRLYILSDDIRSDDIRYFSNVSVDFKRKRFRPGVGMLRVRVHGPGRVRSDAREFRYDVEEDAIVYRPQGKSAFGQTGMVTLEFLWHAGAPRVTYPTRFSLTIPRRR
jgi:hypothetical protein